MQPMVSHATIFLTKAFSLDILIILIAKQIATVVGNPSGTAATISTMLAMNASETVETLAVPRAKK